jgi:hypothetical protein
VVGVAVNVCVFCLGRDECSTLDSYSRGLYSFEDSVEMKNKWVMKPEEKFKREFSLRDVIKMIDMEG